MKFAVDLTLAVVADDLAEALAAVLAGKGKIEVASFRPHWSVDDPDSPGLTPVVDLEAEETEEEDVPEEKAAPVARRKHRKAVAKKVVAKKAPAKKAAAPKSLTKKEMLDNRTKGDLIKLAEKAGVAGKLKSSMKKDEIVEVLAKNPKIKKADL